MMSVGVYIVRSSRPVSTSSRRIAAEQPLLFALRDAVDSGRKLPRDTNAEDLVVADSGRLTRLNLPVSRLRIVAWLIYWSANKRNGPRIAFATMRASRIHQIGAGRSKFGRDGGIRTHDPLTPSQVRYQAALHPEPVDRIRRHGAGNVAVLPAATCSLRIYKEWSRSITKGIRSFGHRSIRARRTSGYASRSSTVCIGPMPRNVARIPKFFPRTFAALKRTCSPAATSNSARRRDIVLCTRSV